MYCSQCCKFSPVSASPPPMAGDVHTFSTPAHPSPSPPASQSDYSPARRTFCTGQDSVGAHKDRHDYFTGEGKLWFDNQNHIASACACSLTVAKAFIKKLREHGYLTIEKRRIHGCAYSNSMTITRDLILASMSPLEAIPKPVAVTPNPRGERVPEYTPAPLPKAAQIAPAPSVIAYDEHFEDQPEWMRDVA
ncbi:hypothetical protein ALP58_02368 [Pseudomonas savastanoi]|uniref:Uncharacterized protein n=1 Tax=Pseudomonas savastanoi TaxID=29438 RepID=A0A3M5G9E0_PSESS|nr:hypothetical protein ALP58_02368 [Pseudomonas savastanoi]